MTITVDVPSPMVYNHTPVLSREVVEAFAFDRPATIVDGTLGLGGHSEAILSAYPDIQVIGLDWDSQALRQASERLSRFGSRFRAVEASYTQLSEVLKSQSISGIDGILLDLGVSSLQLDDAGRGFSFSNRSPLDMRMSLSLPESAWELLQRLDVAELAKIFKIYGEEPHAWGVARAVKDAVTKGGIGNDAWMVAQTMRAALPASRGRIDPATRCFQALRMAVNDELGNIETILSQLPELLNPGGRAVILAFHSLEDRLVKKNFQDAAKGCICPPRIPQCVCGKQPWARLIQRKAIQASAEEISRNPRSRSVRMRMLEKL
jgi:16S rRNA (cytosine1402-N4)-methyltransferase